MSDTGFATISCDRGLMAAAECGLMAFLIIGVLVFITTFYRMSALEITARRMHVEDLRRQKRNSANVDLGLMTNIDLDLLSHRVEEEKARRAH
jgi:hypothetical protein